MVLINKEDAYRGDPGLKRPGTKINWSKEQIEEYIRCKEDVFYFIKKYFKIVTPNGFAKMEVRDYQIDLINSMKDNRFTIALWSRQSGKTESVRAFLIWYILFNEYKSVAVIANKEKVAANIVKKIQLAYKGLPAWLQQGITDWNKGSFTLENNCSIDSFATSSDALRSYTIDILYIDEVAIIEGWEDLYSSIEPTLSSRPESKLIMTSTPKGMNHFYDFWIGCDLNRNTNGFHGSFVPWNRVPGRDEEWRLTELKNISMEKFSQEYECEFLGSSGTLISTGGLKMLEKSIQEPVQTAEYGKMKFYDLPVNQLVGQDINGFDIVTQKPHIYVLMADVSRGKDLDYSAFHIIDITQMPYKQCCTYRSNKVNVADYAAIIHRTATLYNKAYVLVEINDMGEQVGWMLQETFQYENVICTQGASQNKEICWGGTKADIGIRTTKVTKNSGCLLLKLLIEQQKLLLYDSETFNEFKTFSKDKLTYGAEKGKNDDLVMGLVLFGWLSDQKHFHELSDINTIKGVAERSLNDIDSVLIPFGLNVIDYNNGQTYGDPSTTQLINMNVPWNPFKTQDTSPFWQRDPSLGSTVVEEEKAIILPNF